MGSSASMHAHKKLSPEERREKISIIAKQSNMPVEEIEKIADLFDKLDADKSGFVSLRELESAYGGHDAYTLHQASEEIAAADGVGEEQKDKKLSFDEFVIHRARVAKAQKHGVPLKAVIGAHEAYLKMDSDKDGRVVLSEFDKTIGFPADFKAADSDGSAELTFDELLAARVGVLNLMYDPIQRLKVRNAAAAAAVESAEAPAPATGAEALAPSSSTAAPAEAAVPATTDEAPVVAAA